MTIKQQRDLESVRYFIPRIMKNIEITKQNEIDFLQHSERGIIKEREHILLRKADGLDALLEGKRWRGITIHEL